MARKFRREYLNEIIVDTTYLLPILGISVKGLGEEDYNYIIENFRMIYPIPLLAELSAVVIKQTRKKGLKEIPIQAIEGLNSIIYLGKAELLLLRGEDLKIIYMLLNLGWRDIFDSILYATAIRLNKKILTMDKDFKKFLKQNDLKYDILITHKQLKSSSH